MVSELCDWQDAINKIRGCDVITDLNEFGVPQGSKLASDMFLINLNDMKRCLNHCRIKLFADDKLLFVAEAGIESALEKMCIIGCVQTT